MANQICREFGIAEQFREPHRPRQDHLPAERRLRAHLPQRDLHHPALRARPREGLGRFKICRRCYPADCRSNRGPPNCANSVWPKTARIIPMRTVFR